MKALTPRLLLLALATAACGPPAEPAATSGTVADPAKAAQQRPLRRVVTAVAERVALRDVVRLSAEVTPWAAVTVAAEATGRVVELPVEVGDEIAAGTLLARVDDEASRAQLAHSEARVAAAEATLEQAERDLERGRQLAETQDISLTELDRLALGRDTATAQLDADRASARLQQSMVDDAETRAPFAGMVSDRMVEVGSWIAPGSPLVRVIDRRRLKVRGSATQRDRARLTPGLSAAVRVDALPGAVWEGSVRLLGQEADGATGTYLVEVAVREPQAPTGERLLPGMQGSIEVEIGERPALMIPRLALITTADGDGVFVVRDGASDDDGSVARFLQPQTGITAEDRLEILAGLEAGDRVVVAGQHVLHDGDPVEDDSGS
ncbi:MAG: efflux RND transporter periplasmic adaptor subunit [Thermoanaerobaculia bacterium]